MSRLIRVATFYVIVLLAVLAWGLVLTLNARDAEIVIASFAGGVDAARIVPRVWRWADRQD